MSHARDYANAYNPERRIAALERFLEDTGDMFRVFEAVTQSRAGRPRTKLRRAVTLYGVRTCLRAYLSNLRGNGASTIGIEIMPLGHTHTQSADAAINAGERIFRSLHPEYFPPNERD